LGIFLDEVVDKTSNKSGYYIRDSTQQLLVGPNFAVRFGGVMTYKAVYKFIMAAPCHGSPAAKREPEIESCELENREQTLHGTKGKTIKYQPILPGAKRAERSYMTIV
jgi:hypothetical protein